MSGRSMRWILAGSVLAAGTLAAQEPAGDLTLDSLLATPISASAKYSQTATEAASSVTVLTHEDIERFGYRTLPEILSGVSGFYLSNDRNYVYLGARVFSRPTDYNNRFLLMVDGHQLNEPIWGGAPMELPIIPENIERVEIVRGPGSALYGTGALFGVINVVTRRGASLDGGQAEVRTGSMGQRGGAVLFGRRTTWGLDYSVTGLWDGNDGADRHYPEYDSPENNFGLAHDLDWERRSRFMARASFGDWSFASWLSHRSKGIPTAAYGMTFNAPAQTMDSYGFAELRYEPALGASQHLRARAYYDRYRYDGLYAFDGEDSFEWAAADLLGTEISHEWNLASAHRLTTGAEYRRAVRAEYRYLPALPETGGFDAPRTYASLFAEHEFQASRRLTLLAGARIDDESTTRATLVPRAALIFDPWRGTTLKLLYGKAFRSPSVYEGTIASEDFRQDPGLHEERAHTLELVGQQRLGRGLLGTMSLFRYRVRDLIDLTVDSADEMYVYRNLGRTTTTGAEAGLEARFPGLTGFANYTFTRAKDGAGETLSNSPDHVLKAGAAVALGPRLGSALEGRYESSRRTVYDTRTHDYAVANLHLWFSPLRHPHEGDDGMLISLRVNNLFDSHYALPGGVEHVQDAIEQDGRTVSAELRYRF